MSYLDDLTTHVHAGFPDLVFGTNLFTEVNPDQDNVPDAIVAILGRPGTVDETFTTILPRPGFQILVRGAPYDKTTPENLAWALWRYLAPIAGLTVGDTHFIRIHPDNTPSWLSSDSKHRAQYTNDWEAQIV